MEIEELKFEEAFKKLEEISKRLEDPELSLEESIELFKEGVALYKYCKKKLNEARLKVKDVLKDLEEVE